MKQRIRVVGIVRGEHGVLVGKRSHGRRDGAPVWELPTGKIKFGEQPEEALARVFQEDLGVAAEKVVLRDAITFLAPVGASQLSNLYIIYNVILPKEAKIAAREQYSAYKYINVEEASAYHLDEASMTALEIEERGDGKLRESQKVVANSATVYVDGSSRGNPGPSGIGYYIVGERGEVLACGGEFIGFATARVAEYYALKEGCEQAIELGLKSVRFVSDNLMMVNQMNGIYKVKNRDLLAIYDDIQELLKHFDTYAFTHVVREYNVHADEQANLAIDRELGR